MPFLRVTCDKRGVETTALLHTTRGHAKGKPRLLYWFRTPPDIRVGRAAIDEAAISQLERAHPDVEFDWPQILHASKSLAAAGARRARDERPASSGRRPQPQPEQAMAPAPAAGAARGPGELPASPSEAGRRRQPRRGGSRQRPKGEAGTRSDADR